MAIPEGVETVTVSSGEPMTLPDGTLIRGHIRFVAPDLNIIGDEDFIFGGESTAELCHGEFSITLVAPDATGITPTGWTYTAIGEFVNAPDWVRYIDITKDDPNVFLDDVIVLTPGDITNPDTTFVRKAGDTMTGFLTLSADPTAPLHAATKQYVDNAFDPDQFVEITGDTMTGELVLFGNPTQALGASPKQYTDAQAAAAQAAAAAESVSLSGDTMTGPLVLNADPSLALGAATKQYVDQAEADAVSSATAIAAAESVSLSGDTMTGPLVLSGAPASPNGAATKAYVDTTAAAAQAAAEANAAAESVSITGDTMTGPLVLNADPSLALGAATKQYVDQAESDAIAAAAAESVSLTGDTMSGQLVLFGNPTVALGAAPRQYVDAGDAATLAAAAAESVSLTGDTMTGALVLFGDPVVALGAATKQYAESVADAAQAAAEATAAAESVSLTGDTMTGPLILNADPVNALGAATKQYVDQAQADAEANAAAESVSLSGDTMTGPLILNADPVNALGAATKQFVEAEAAAAQAAAEATAAAESVSLTGDTMTGELVLFGDPTVALGATPKQYVDGLDAQNVKLTGNQTIAGIKTFTSIPVGPASDPISDDQLTRKFYVDTLDAQNVKLTGAQTIAGVKTFSSIPVLPGTDPVAANEAVRKAYVDTLDAQNVKITGTQSIAGLKTFTDALAITDGADVNLLTVTQTNVAATAGVMRLVAGSATQQAFLGSYQGAAANSWAIRADGRYEAGDGTGARDTLLARIAAGVWQATSQIRVTGSAPSNAADLTRKDYVDTLDAQNVKLTGDQTIAGIKTFSSIPVLPASDPTTANQATRKQYVDDEIASEILERTGLSTGVLTGGELNVNGINSTQVDIGLTTGVVLDYTTTPTAPTLTKVTVSAQTVTILNLSAPVTWFLADSAGVVSQQTTRPTNSQRRTHLVLGGVLVVGGVGVEDQSLPNYLPQTTNQLIDLMDAIGPFNITGNVLSAASTDLTVAKTSGTVFSRAFNHFAGATLTNDPHVSSTPAQNPMQWRYATQVSTTPGALVTSVDPANYDNAGVVTAIGGAATSATIQRVFLTPLNATANQVAIQYGQTVFANLDAAVAAVGSAQYVKNPNLADAVLIGYIVCTRVASDLSNPAHARIIVASRFSGNPSGTGDALSLAVLKSGDTMTGPLILSGDPSNVLGAATKQYVDGLDATSVKLTGAQTVAGVKTFSSIPVGPASDPTTGNQLTRKTYVDNLDAANVKLTGAQSIAGVKTFSSIPVGPSSDPTTNDQLSRKLYVDNGDAAVAATVTALDAAVVKLTGDQSVAGIKTFSSIPVLPASDPTTANQATRKSYVDALDAANVKLTGAQAVAGIKTFSSAPVFSAGVTISAGIRSLRFARKTAATSRASTTTVAADPHLVVAVEANAVYKVDVFVGWTNGGGGFKAAFTGPSGATMNWTDNDGGYSSAIGTTQSFNTTVGTTFVGTLDTAGTAGNLTLVWAQDSSNAANTTLAAGCYISVERVE